MPEANSTPGDRDVSQVSRSDWNTRDFPSSGGPRSDAYQVVVRRSVINHIYEHGQSSPDVEICGVLVGDVYQDEIGPFLFVEAAIRGDFADRQVAQVTFTADTWSHIHTVMETKYPTQRIVGWYHTHPGFGIFLSPMDLFIHENFFGLPWQIAIVYDPLAGDDGLFVWSAGQPKREGFLIEEDAMKVDPQVTLKGPARYPRGREDNEVLAQYSSRLMSIERRQKWTIIGSGAIGLVLIAWMVVITTHLPPVPKKVKLPPSPPNQIRPPVAERHPSHEANKGDHSEGSQRKGARQGHGAAQGNRPSDRRDSVPPDLPGDEAPMDRVPRQETRVPRVHRGPKSGKSQLKPRQEGEMDVKEWPPAPQPSTAPASRHLIPRTHDQPE